MSKKNADTDYSRISKEGLISGVLFALFVRWCVAQYPHSGQNEPPMYGDFEAQRHWQEITVHIPTSQWYFNTTQNNLQYWGLDYPPLTAYHSFIMGLLADMLEPESVRLFASRGFESESHKRFMRWTVFISDVYFYITAVLCICIYADKNKGKDTRNVFIRADISTIMCLLYPGLILIDHGHFQYNVISLGLFLWAAFTLVILDNSIISSIFFVMAINYKQMELYHALPFFCYMLKQCMTRPSVLAVLNQLNKLAISVVCVFIIVWLPFLTSVFQVLQRKHSQVLQERSISQVLQRIFPLSRGVFEDKVSNIWCAVNVLVKLKTIFNNTEMAKICLLCTLCAACPSCVDLYFRINKRKFMLSLINVSLAFFLYSFQVHEKTILLCAIPVAMHLPYDPYPCFWFLLVSNFSMLPLFIKDQLLIPFLATNLIYISFYSLCLKISDPKSSFLSYFDLTSAQKTANKQKAKDTTWKSIANLTFVISLLTMMLLTICIIFMQPPSHLPDLFPLLISVLSCVHFKMFYLYFNYTQFLIPSQVVKLKNI